MSHHTFKSAQRENQINWRKSNITTDEWGWQNGKSYSHIVPKSHWQETVWQDIRESLSEYLKQNDIKEHTGVHNLLSSWVVCANLYYPVQIMEHFRVLMLKFLQQKISSEISELSDTQLEFAFEMDSDFHPSKLLGEMDGGRGSGQTSPDVAFLVKTKKGKGIVLTECKYTEHSFYPCSARSVKGRENAPDNPDPKRCMNSKNDIGYKEICHQTVWGRKYWDHLHFSPLAKETVTRCPAATGGYQLFRQQSLSEGIAKSGLYDMVVSSVAFDGKNTGLISCLKSTGIEDFQSDWAELWDGSAMFKTWHHQEWVEFVRQNDSTGTCRGWLDYLNERYGY